MNMNKYILVDREPVIADDLMAWAQWFEQADRHVAQDELPNGVRISTVFIGLDHRFGSDGPPLLFETMIFGGAHDDYQERYATWDEAVAGHAIAVALASA